MLSVWLLLAAVTVGNADPGGLVVDDSVTDWQEAALNYEYAADAQEQAAAEALVEASYWRDAVHEDLAKARRSRIQSAKKQLRAADLLVAASGSLDQAGRVWGQAASVAGRETASGQYFQSSSVSAKSRAVSLLRQAVGLCEQAADVFSAEEDLLSQASANHKAAGLRERLAKR